MMVAGQAGQCQAIWSKCTTPGRCLPEGNLVVQDTCRGRFITQSLFGLQRHPTCRRKSTRDAVWTDNGCQKAVRVQCKLAASNGHLRTVRPSKLGVELQRLCEEGQLDSALNLLLRMEQNGAGPSFHLYRSLLKACGRIKALAQVRGVYAHLQQQGLEWSRVLGEDVVNTLVKCGGFDDALQVFQRLPHRTVLSWTAVISGYNKSGRGHDALRIYHRMREEGVEPDAYTFVSLLKACGSTSDLEEGKRIHREAVKHRLGADLFVCSSLIDMYGRCGSVRDAWHVFDGMAQRNVGSWNAMLAVYVQQNQAEKALQLYGQMQKEGESPNNRTFVWTLQACGILAEQEKGVVVEEQMTKVMSLRKVKGLHADARAKGFDSDVVVGIPLVSVYGKCGSVVEARKAFDGLPRQEVVTWNVMLAVYDQQGQADKVLQLYNEMQDEGVPANNRTFVSALHACGLLADKERNAVVHGPEQATEAKSLVKGRAIRADAQKKGYDSDTFVGNTLISMYGKCGSIADAEEVFELLSQRTVVSWNAMIAAYVECGQAESALELYGQMRVKGVIAVPRTFVRVVQACSMLAEKEEDVVVFEGRTIKMESLKSGTVVHADARMMGSDSDVFVGNALVSMYGKCGTIMDAQNVFNGLSNCDIVSWNTLVSAYAQQNQAGKALELYEVMQQEGVSPDAWTYVSVLQACTLLAEKEEGATVGGQLMKVKSLNKAKAIQSAAHKKCFESDVYIGNILVTAYGKCGSVMDAWIIFERLCHRDMVTWNAMLTGYAQGGQSEKVLQLYEDMCSQGVVPDARTFVTVLQACDNLAEKEQEVLVDSRLIKVKFLQMLKAIHAAAQIKRCDADILVGIVIISMYGKHGSCADARIVFDGLLHRDVLSWNAMLGAYAQQGQPESVLQFYEQMMKDGVSPNSQTFVIALQACGMLAEKEEDFVVHGPSNKLKSLQHGKAIHGDAEEKGCDSDVFVGNTLVSMYGKCGSIVDAREVFDGMPQRTVVSWNAMLAAYVDQGQPEKALLIYEQMREEGVSTNDRTFVAAIQACGLLAEVEEGDVDVKSTRLKSLKRGRTVHKEAERKGYDRDAFVGNTLVTMYGKCGSIADAQNVFDHLSEWNVVSWNAMLAAYIDQGYADQALQLYAKMQEEEVNPDSRTFVNVLHACGMLANNEDAVFDGGTTKVKSLEKGMAIHAAACKLGQVSDVFVSSALVTMYGKCGSIDDARTVFDGLSRREVVTWTAMLAAYVDQGQSEMALQLFRQMREEGPSPNEITIVYIMQACSNTGSLVFLREIHHSLLSVTNNLTPLLANTLIGAYGRCASMVDAQSVFDALLHPNLVSWTALIAGYAREGNWAVSLQWYEKMQLAKMKPDGVTFLALLSACSHAGLVDEGVQYFEAMTNVYGICPGIDHYASLVDLFARAGCFSRIEELLSTMPMPPNLDIWLCVLAACRKHGKAVLGKQAFDCAVCLQPKHAAAYILMSNLYADAGLWDRAKEVRESGQKAGAWKKPPGQSWIQHEQEVHTFLVGECLHPQKEQLHDLLGRVSPDMNRRSDMQGSYTSNLAVATNYRVIYSLI